MREGRWTESGEFVSLNLIARSWCLLARMQIDWSVLPSPISTKIVKPRKADVIINLTIAQNTMQLELRKESEPVNTILLIFPQLCLDRDRNVVLLNLTSIEKLCQEGSFFVSSAQQIFGEIGRVGKTGLQNHMVNSALILIESITNLKGHHFYQGSECICRCRSNVIVRIAHASKDRYD